MANRPKQQQSYLHRFMSIICKYVWIYLFIYLFEFQVYRNEWDNKGLKYRVLLILVVSMQLFICIYNNSNTASYDHSYGYVNIQSIYVTPCILNFNTKTEQKKNNAIVHTQGYTHMVFTHVLFFSVVLFNWIKSIS